MEIPTTLASFVVEDPVCPAEWLTSDLSRILTGKASPTGVDPSFLSLDDLRSLLAQRQYNTCRLVRIPPLFDYHSVIIQYYASSLVDLLPNNLLVELLDYGLGYELIVPEEIATICTSVRAKVQQARIATLTAILARDPDMLAKLHHQHPAVLARVMNDKELYYHILASRIEKLDTTTLQAQARELHINPFLPVAKLRNELALFARKVATTASDIMVTEARCRMLDYWRLVVQVEFRTVVEQPANEDNCVAENTLDYGSFDVIPVLEGSCLYLLTSVEWKSILQKKENPWTRQPLTPEALELLRGRFQAIRKGELPEVPVAFPDALVKFRALYIPPVPVVPIRQDDVYIQLAEELHEFYITEENLRSLTRFRIMLLQVTLAESGIVLPLRDYDVATFLQYLYEMIQSRPSTRASVAIALLAIS